MSELKLYLGDRNRSGQSLPPYLALAQVKQPFERVGLPIGDEEQNAHADAPSGHVPALVGAGAPLSGALAVCERIAERFPAAQLWPSHKDDLAAARALAGATYPALERELPFRFLEKKPAPALSAAGKAELEALQQSWAQHRFRYEKLGPYLVGKLSIADCMAAPLASRVLTYDLTLEKTAQAYVTTLLELPALKRWAEAAALDLADAAKKP
jgi:glutathione S-transferase